MCGLSALVVLVGHVLTGLPWDPVIGTQYQVQTYAVAVFFILSGFLIGYYATLRAEVYSFLEYMIDRACRIFVAFIPALIFVAVVDLTITAHFHQFRPGVHSPATFVANLFMLQHTPFNRYFDWLPTFQPFGTGRPFWTIAVEWWLYALFGIVFFAGRMRGSWRGYLCLSLLRS